MRSCEVQSRISRKIAVDDLQARVQDALPRNNFRRKLAADGRSAKNAGIKVEKLHGEILSVNAYWGAWGGGIHLRISRMN